jgi:hypothetical protein
MDGGSGGGEAGFLDAESARPWIRGDLEDVHRRGHGGRCGRPSVALAFAEGDLGQQGADSGVVEVMAAFVERKAAAQRPSTAAIDRDPNAT